MGTVVRVLRRLWPWLVGVAIVVVIATQVPLDQFRRSLSQGPHIALAATELGIAVLVLLTDSFSTWIGMLGLKIRWPLGQTLWIRGATYLLVLVNYAVGQGGFGYYLYRSGISVRRAVGATLFLLGTTFAALLTLTFGIWAVTGGSTANDEMWWTLVVAMIAFALYLVLIATRVGVLARREVLAPLFDAGIEGHLLAIFARLPHIAIVVLGYWAPMLVWGIDVPFLAAITLMPAVALAAVLPISPAGLGTTQAAMVFFFSSYAPGETEDQRVASVLAFGVVHFVYMLASTALVGLACIPAARRTGLFAKAKADTA